MRSFYHGKRILITGASSGIGKDLAIFLATFNTKLILLARRAEMLNEVKRECEEKGAEVLIFVADVSNREEMERIAAQVLAQYGFVDIVIGNAGVGGLNPADKFSLDIHKWTVDINIHGLVNTLVPFIPSMIKERKGQLVGVSSLAAFRGLPNAASYSSTKSAQKILLESFRVDLRKYNIAVSSIHPGFVETPMTNHDEFKMPFMVPVRKSSVMVAKAIMQRKAFYLYPWQMRILTCLNRLLPAFIYDRLVPALAGQKKNIAAKIF